MTNLINSNMVMPYIYSRYINHVLQYNPLKFVVLETLQHIQNITFIFLLGKYFNLSLTQFSCGAQDIHNSIINIPYICVCEPIVIDNKPITLQTIKFTTTNKLKKINFKDERH